MTDLSQLTDDDRARLASWNSVGITATGVASPRNLGGNNVTAGHLAELTSGQETSLHSHAGASASGIQYRDVQLTDAQIKALPTTPVEIIPAPGPDLVVVPMMFSFGAGFIAVMELHANYANIYASAVLNFYVGNGPNVSFSIALGYPDLTLFFAPDGWVLPLRTMLNIAASGYGPDAFLVDWVNSPLQLLLLNAQLGNLTGGDPANTLSVRVWYAIVPAVPFGTPA